jgi:glutathione S-transferase
MDFYFSPFACSFAGHVLIREANLPVSTIPVSLSRKQTADGTDFFTVTRKGLVPVLRFDDGHVLTESSAILQVLAEMAPQAGYLPERGTRACHEVLEWLSFVSTEIHKHCLYPIFLKDAPEECKAWALELLPRKLALAASRLAHQPYLAAGRFTIADAYLGWALMLCEQARIGLPQEAALQDYWQRLRARPAFAECMALEQRLYREYA